MNKKYYCDICNKHIINKSSHNISKSHTQLSSSVINKYVIPSIPVIEIDEVVNKYIHDYRKKFHDFNCWCKIQNDYFCDRSKVIYKRIPFKVRVRGKIMKRYNCKRDDLVKIEIVFISDLESATYNHYLQMSKPMIERKICQIIDQNPNLIRTLDCMPEPYKRHIISKHWKYREPNIL